MSTRAKCYGLGTGSWLNRAPGGFSMGDVNLFRFVGNEPTDHVDATGLTDILGINPDNPFNVPWLRHVPGVLPKPLNPNKPDRPLTDPPIVIIPLAPPAETWGRGPVTTAGPIKITPTVINKQAAVIIDLGNGTKVTLKGVNIKDVPKMIEKGEIPSIKQLGPNIQIQVGPNAPVPMK